MNEHEFRQPRLTTHTRAGDQSIFHRREFAAAAESVQRAHTDPDIFAQWMGPDGTTVRIERHDAITGGSFRYIVESTAGGRWPFRGSYHVVIPGLIVHTWEYEDEPNITLETLRFVELGPDVSVLEVTSTYASREACEAMLASGLDDGMDNNFERLDAVLAHIEAQMSVRSTPPRHGTGTR